MDVRFCILSSNIGPPRFDRLPIRKNEIVEVRGSQLNLENYDGLAQQDASCELGPG